MRRFVGIFLMASLSVFGVGACDDAPDDRTEIDEDDDRLGPGDGNDETGPGR